MTYTVTALGIANSGKSSLLSALADTPELFPSGDVPGVTTSAARHVVGPLVLEDTPGLDAGDAGEARTLRAAQLADTLLWCHSLRMGDLRPTEIAALRACSRNSSILWRTCFVLTHRDDVASRTHVQDVSRRIARQLEDIFGLPFQGDGEPSRPTPSGRNPRPFDYIGSATYWKGAGAPPGQRRDSLLRRSGVPALRNFLHHLAHRKGERFHGRS